VGDGGGEGSPCQHEQEDSRTSLLQSVQDILNTSMETSTPATNPSSPRDSLAEDSEPGDPVFKIPDISDLKSSHISSYFAPSARSRIARGEQFGVRARRLLLGGEVAYLIEWENSASS